jgi:hypothetical protein
MSIRCRQCGRRGATQRVYARLSGGRRHWEAILVLCDDCMAIAEALLEQAAVDSTAYSVVPLPGFGQPPPSD